MSVRSLTTCPEHLDSEKGKPPNGWQSRFANLETYCYFFEERNLCLSTTRISIASKQKHCHISRNDHGGELAAGVSIYPDKNRYMPCGDNPESHCGVLCYGIKSSHTKATGTSFFTSQESNHIRCSPSGLTGIVG